MVSFAGAIWTSVKITIIKVFARKPELHPPALLWFSASCVVDVLITASLVRSLSQRKTGFTDTDGAIDRIIRLTVQTGMLTAIAAVGEVVFFTVLPRTALNFLWDLALSKIYTNSLMSTLNARAGWNNLISQHHHANVLFSENSVSGRQNDNVNANNSMLFRSGPSMLELEDQQPFRQPAIQNGRHEAYGVKVTKVVERVVEPTQ